MENTVKNETHLFKSGNSWALRVGSKDRKALNADKNTKFKKTISADGNVIKFTKVDDVDPEVKSYLNDLYDENKTLMERLKNL